mmetsp:Transcript_8212/g.34480  ORF Transcript_8212/g.34480 Transcript_8212/m.34480 type:complete len:254 (-) Transcript_8212:310-1071(-)
MKRGVDRGGGDGLFVSLSLLLFLAVVVALPRAGACLVEVELVLVAVDVLESAVEHFTDEKNLRRGNGEGHAIVEVGVARAVVDPTVPCDGHEQRKHKEENEEHHEEPEEERSHKRREQREESKFNGEVCHSGVWLECRQESENDPKEQHWLLVETDREWREVEEAVQLEYCAEERPEVVKHLLKEVPKEPNVRRQVRHLHYDVVRAVHPIPRPSAHLIAELDQQANVRQEHAHRHHLAVLQQKCHGDQQLNGI